MERSVALIVHPTKREAWNFAGQLTSWLEARQTRVCLDEETAQRLAQPALACPPEIWNQSAFIITLGGDGTILTAARRAAPLGIPILGVHMGTFGFLAETKPANVYRYLETILNDTPRIEERLMVRAEIYRDGQCAHSEVGLNDAVVKSAMSQLLHLKTSLGGMPFATYAADGIIVATPSGSTAYALSAGGPVVAPTVRALVVVPICPHTLSARPMVVPSEETIEIVIEDVKDDVVFAVDGIARYTLQEGDRMVVHRADFVTRLIVPEPGTFYQKVRGRYLYGQRHDQAHE